MRFVLSSKLWLLAAFLLLTALGGQRSSTQALTPPPPRRVNISPFSRTYEWSQTAVLWFGVNDSFTQIPGRNYADVRLGYSQTNLLIRLTVIDYYLWFDTSPAAASDLTQYDAIALYLDTRNDKTAVPQNDDYQFLFQARRNQPHTNYHREAQGSGSGWDFGWSGSWTSQATMDWSDAGPNDNGGNIDYGWTGIYVIPWATFGLSGPPAGGTVWGMGLELFDRDAQPPAGGVAPQTWPENVQSGSPATWGELHIGSASYTPSTTAVTGTTTIRANSPADNTVEDAWMGGGGLCAGGHEGGSSVNHGNDADLFTGSEIRATHFPCFNKSFLRFDLSAIPPGKEIVSAELTLHLFGHAGQDPNQADPSWISLHSIKDPWQEMGIHWNNAPLAYENVSAAWVNPYSGDRDNPVWPGDAYTWDASKAVAEAYSAGQPVSMALYGSDTDQHSSKYYKSSEADDGIAGARPVLVVRWADLGPTLTKTAVPSFGTTNDPISYTIRLTGDGNTLNLVDTLPAGLSVQTGSLTGGLSYNASQRQFTWSGTPASGEERTFTYTAVITANGRQALINQASLSSSGSQVAAASAAVIVDPVQAYLPIVQR
jgi:uncharacterized repeat protein (TIGR01451 family)